jgi:hypothetical protein
MKVPTGKLNLPYRPHAAATKPYKCLQKSTKSMDWQVTISRVESWGRMEEENEPTQINWVKKKITSPFTVDTVRY